MVYKSSAGTVEAPSPADMWTTTVLVACVAALSAAASLPQEPDTHFQASKDYLQRQKQILQLFLNPQEEDVFPDFAEIIKNYRIEEHTDKYQETSYAKRFVKYQKAGALYPKEKIFSPYSEKATNELKLIFDLLYYAKDFDTFLKTAVILRTEVNMGLFINAFVTAMEAREDTRGYYIPPRYEYYAYMFVDERVIQKALLAKIKALQSGNRSTVVIHSNYTGYWNSELNPETSLYYFTEDVGLNAFNAEFDRRFPAWWDSHKYQVSHDRQGELYLHYQRQLLSRYYLERLSNNLGDIPYLSKNSILPAYYPRLRHSNGKEVTPRQPFTYVRDTEEILVSEITYEASNLWKAIDTGSVLDVNGTKIPLEYPQGVDVLGKLAYFYGDSPNPNLYGSYIYDLIHHMGHIADPDYDYDVAPSALMRSETALRDPLYYSIVNKFFDDIYYRYIEQVPKHTFDDVLMPGMKIEDVYVDELSTFFEDFDIDLMNVHNMEFHREQMVDIYARVRRLNHRHFNFKVSVDSEKEFDATVKVLIAPKYDSQNRLIPMNKRMFYSFEIDRFYTKVPAGKSVIERNSKDSTVAVDDPPTFSEIWEKIHSALEDEEPFNVDLFARPNGFPQRLLLPKGRRSGLPVLFIVAIFPYQEADVTDRRVYHMDSFPLLGASYGVKYPDPRPIAFPIDKMYRSEYDAHVPNIFTKEVRIYHKTQEEHNIVPKQ